LDGKTVSVHRTYYDYDGRKKKEVNPAMYNSMYDTGKDYIERHLRFMSMMYTAE